MTIDLPPLRAGMPASEALLARRAGMAGPPTGAPEGCHLEEAHIGGVPCVVVAPESWRHELVYLHGGGYRLGRPAVWLSLAARLAAAVTARVTIADYRLAPEDPFPAAVHDAVAVYRAVRERAGGKAVLLGGDSAGGGLAAAVTAALMGGPASGPDGLILLSPWLDLTFSGETHTSRASRDLLFPPSNSVEAAAIYLQGAPADHPLASPLFAEVVGFPPALLLVGSEETLLDDSLRFAGRLAEAGSSVTLHVAAGMQHVWPLLSPGAPETAEALALAKVFSARLED